MLLFSQSADFLVHADFVMDLCRHIYIILTFILHKLYGTFNKQYQIFQSPCYIYLTYEAFSKSAVWSLIKIIRQKEFLLTVLISYKPIHFTP